MAKRNLLFIAESVTLAHVARMFAMASELGSTHKTRLVCGKGYAHLFEGQGDCELTTDLYCVEPSRFRAALRAGKPLYDGATLQKYVESDNRLIEKYQPDVVVGDFRVSLSVSARLNAVPYVSVINAYWSPFARPKYYLPDIPVARMLGQRIGQVLFDLVRPVAFAGHTKPLNGLRKKYGLTDLGRDLRNVYCDADAVLYPDLESIIPTYDRPATHSYVGPLSWEPDVPLPDWWATWPAGKFVVYVTMGSSGDASLLKSIVATVAEAGGVSIVSTAGVSLDLGSEKSTYAVPYLPGSQAAQVADLVICNGGSPTTQQALSCGKPVIGIADNLDQFLNMYYLEQAGVGALLRSYNVNSAKIKAAVEAIRNEPRFSKNAVRVGADLVLAQRGRNLVATLEHTLQAINESR